MLLKLPYELGNDLEFYLCERYPAISTDWIGGGLGPKITPQEPVRAFRKVVLDPVENTYSEQYVKLYIKNASNVPLWQVMVYLLPTGGSWFVGIEQKNVTQTVYLPNQPFPTDALAQNFAPARGQSSALLAANVLEPEEFVAVWVKCVVTYAQLVLSPSFDVSCAVVAVYNKTVGGN